MQLVGQNRLELLLSRLDGNQLYDINVFKVREVLQCSRLTVMPKSNPVVRGVANIHGGTIPTLDLALVTGHRGLRDLTSSFAIVTGYSIKVQDFLMHSMERIVNMNQEEIHSPPKSTGREHYLTAATQVDKQLVEITDMEKVSVEAVPTSEKVSPGAVGAETQSRAAARRVLVVDGSSVAHKQVAHCLEAIGAEMAALSDGRQALEYLQNMFAGGRRSKDELLMLISGIEVSEMGGYTLMTETRSDPRLQRLHILLYTSLSGILNQVVVKRVDADNSLARFYPGDLATRVAEQIGTVDAG